MPLEFVARNGLISQGNLVVSGSITSTGTVTISGSIASASFAATASSADNFLARGTITAQTLVVQTITSSVDFVTGSTKFGSLSSNTHQFTGSMSVSGSGNFISSVTANSLNVNTSTVFARANIADALTATSIGTNYNPGILNIQNSSATNGNLSLIGFQDATAFINLAAIGAINTTHNASPNSVVGELAFYTKTSGTGYITERLRITSAGDMFLTGRSTNTDYGMYFYSSDTDSRIYSSNSSAISKPILFYTSGSERLRITSGGKIGIGLNMTSPVSQVSIGVGNVSTVGALASAGLAINSYDNNVVVGNLSQISLGLQNVYTPAYIGYVVTTATAYTYGDLIFGTRGVNTDTAPTERMRITSGGNVLLSSDKVLGINTSDGSDNGYLALCGASADGDTRGARIYLSGNERTVDAGNIVIAAGNSTSGTGAPGTIVFRTGADTERMRITSGGNVAITNNLAVGRAEENGVRLSVTSPNTLSSNYNIISRDSSGNDLFVLRNDGLYYTGTRSLSPYNYGVTAGVKALYVDSNGALGYNASTRESKANITNIDSVNWIHSLQPVTFNKKKKDNEGNYTEELESELQYGLIAEDVESVNPNFVFYNSDGKLAGVHYDRLVTPLIKAIQELKTQNDSLQSQINELKAQ